MIFRKPPIIEAWIEFHVDLTDEQNEFDKNDVMRFIEHELQGFAPHDVGYQAVEQTVAVDSESHVRWQEPKVVFDRVRARNQNKELCLQIGRNFLICNLLKVGNEWKRFEYLQDAAFNALENYLDFRGINHLLMVVIHYRDLIDIPSDGKIRLEQYFTVHPQIPEDFGSLAAYDIRVSLPHVCPNGLTQLQIRSMPSEAIEGKSHHRFLMDWHSTSQFSRRVEVEETKLWLKAAHDKFSELFQKTFTQEGLALFEPEVD